MPKSNTGTAQNWLTPCSEGPLLALMSAWKYTLNKKMKKYAFEAKNQEEFFKLICVYEFFQIVIVPEVLLYKNLLI